MPSTTQRHVERIATRLCSGVSLRASEANPHDTTGTHSVSLALRRALVVGLPEPTLPEPDAIAQHARMDAGRQGSPRQGTPGHEGAAL